jgi:hypothetical protein
MTWTEQQLQMVERMGAVHSSWKEVLTVLGLSDSSEAMNAISDSNSPAQQAYKRGKLKSELEVREAIFLAAKNGSSPAQTLARQIITESKMKDVG